MRLQKYLANSGVASRRKSEQWIAQGLVSVNGQVIREMGVQVMPGDEVRVRGELVTPAGERIYLMYHKPAGQVSTASDERGRPTVMDGFSALPARVYPVGRLDADSEGLLLLTNDGELTHRLLHPASQVQKVYLAKITGQLSPENMQALQQGVWLAEETRPTAPAGIEVLERTPFASTVRVTLREGRNRQVRRMFAAVGHRVLSLRRVQFGPLKLGALPRGASRPLTQEEVAALKGL